MPSLKTSSVCGLWGSGKKMEGEKQVRLGNLDKMTVPQLQELLDRQKKLLVQKPILQTLPDKGQKVKDFAARLQQMILQYNSPEAGAQSPTSGKSHPPHDRTQTTSYEATSFHSVPVCDTDDTLAELERESLGSGEAVDGTAVLSEALDGLVISELTAQRMTEKHSDISRNVDNLETRFPNSYENVIKRSQTAETKKQPFKPNSSLKISDIHQLPEDYKCKSRTSVVASSSSQTATQSRDSCAKGRKKESVKASKDSAVTGPDYMFKGAKEISLQESLVLQKQQKDNLERIQTLHAAERLAERLNIKTLDYNPSALDMQYRSNAVDDDGNTYDSDDDSDDNADMPE